MTYQHEGSLNPLFTHFITILKLNVITDALSDVQKEVLLFEFLLRMVINLWHTAVFC